MLYLSLAVLSSAMIAILMRISEKHITADLSMLAVNYLMCAVLGAAYTGFESTAFHNAGFFLTIWLGMISGFLYLGGFVLFQKNVSKYGVVLSSVFMKLGLLVPVVLSVWLFKEFPTASQVTGFCIAVAAIVLINLKKEQDRQGAGWGLILMLLLCGSSDAMSKVFERLGPAPYSDFYLFCTFVAAFLLCAAGVKYKGEKIGSQEILYGALIGIPNFFSAKFLLKSLTKLPAVVVYPSFSVAALLVVTMTGVLVFKERLSKLQWGALAAIIAALIFLNI